MTKKIAAGSTIGIIGAGQLGKMLAQSAQKMGYRVAIYDPNPSSCSFNLAHSHTVASFDDEEALLDFVRSVDVLTYEFENINGELLKRLAEEAYLPQGTDLLLKSQDRLIEKNWLNSLDVPTVKFAQVDSLAGLRQLLVEVGYPAVLKTARLGYDGKGQWLLRSLDDVIDNQVEIEAGLRQQTLILEAFCDFEYEISVIVSRDTYGTVKTFPVSTNQHIHGILYSSIVGHSFPETVFNRIHDYAEKIAEAGHLVGVCGIEFFLTQSGQLMVNEIAPRPHNSGHYTIEACNISQFDQHIIAITGYPLVDIRLLEPALMINILGQHLPYIPSMREELPQALFHIYGKGEAKYQRKMGHFTITHPSYNVLKSILENNEKIAAWQKLY